MNPAPRLSDAEWEVMNIVWRKSGPVLANDVVMALSAHKTWNPRTIKTFLGRLIKKGVLQYRTEGNRYWYSPAVSREECVREESRSFAERIMAEEPTPALLHLVQQTSLTPDEVEKLKKALDEKGSGGARVD
jgi:BlaI family penicillinase repressor